MTDALLNPGSTRSRAAFVLFCGFTSALLSGCGNEDAAPAETKPPRVVTIVAEEQVFRPGFNLPGTVSAISSVELRPEIAATIEARNVEPGASVSEGDVLFELDDSRYRAALEAAEASLEQALAARDRALSDLNRVERGSETGAVARMKFDEASATARSSAAAVRSAEAAVEKAKIDLEDATIRAPFAGKISAARFSRGDYVTPAGPPLAQIVQIDPVYVVVEVDQKEAEIFAAIRRRLRDEGVLTPELQLVIVLPSGEEYEHPGEFLNVDPTGASSRGTIRIWSTFANPGEVLVPGYNVTLRGRDEVALEQIVIPQKAIQQDQKGNFVFCIGEDRRVVRKDVEVGVKQGPNWAIRSGLEVGDEVIVEGVLKVTEGSEVRIVDPLGSPGAKKGGGTPDVEVDNALEAAQEALDDEAGSGAGSVPGGDDTGPGSQ